jgi:hypothetical protein
MKLTLSELEFLSAWAREEWEPECYKLPAHRLQLAHGLTGAFLIDLIKAWTETEGKKDEDIIKAATNADPSWPCGLPRRSLACGWNKPEGRLLRSPPGK